MVIIGIDPGLNGGMAIFHVNRNCGDFNYELVFTSAMPTKEENGKTKLDILELKKIIMEHEDDSNISNAKFIIEHVGAMPGQGVTSMFTFGEVYGSLKTFCLMLNDKEPYEVTPLKWKNLVLKDYDFKQKLSKFVPDKGKTKEENNALKKEWLREKARAKKMSKQCSIQYCKDKFPNANLKATERSKVDHDGIADAVCIGMYQVIQTFSELDKTDSCVKPQSKNKSNAIVKTVVGNKISEKELNEIWEW